VGIRARGTKRAIATNFLTGGHVLMWSAERHVLFIPFGRSAAWNLTGVRRRVKRVD